MRDFAGLYPGDPTVIAPLYLNVFRLRPGEAIFLKAGVLHAYIRGFGVELMANSDNVLRGGLTPKHVDVPELMKVLDFSPLNPLVMKPDPGAASFTYPVPCREFSLTVMRGTGDQVALDQNGPSICIVTEGEARIGGELLRKGESIFVPARGPGEKPLSLRGDYTAHVASTGKPA
jgi:mannose-6-phosphate isomerase